MVKQDKFSVIIKTKDEQFENLQIIKYKHPNNNDNYNIFYKIKELNSKIFINFFVNVNLNNKQTIFELIYECFQIIITQIKSLLDKPYDYSIMIYFIGNFGQNIKLETFSPINYNNNVLTLWKMFS